jgi:hypothetical protein
MSKVVSYRLSEKDWKILKEEADSIPSSPGEHAKFWWLERNNSLRDSFDSGYEQCKRDYGMAPKK